MSTAGTTLSKADITTVDSIWSPVRLSYTAALRGLVPHAPKTAFAWAQIGCTKVEPFLCLAASNPEGRFFAVVSDPDFCDRAQKQANIRHVTNVSFLTTTNVLRDLDYLVCDSAETPMTRKELATLAKTALRPNGLLAYHYRAYPNADEILRFIANEFSPEMTVEQARVFLQELKALGTNYFGSHPIAAAALEKAIAQNVPDQFFSTCEQGAKATSGTFDTMVDFGEGGLVYVGDADIQKNYMDLVAPPSSHEILIKCQSSFLYEPIKDFVIQRLDRCDVWCRTPLDRTEDLAVLFNNFTFGITLDKAKIPSSLTMNGKTIQLDQAPYTALIDLMTNMPLCVGDFLHHKTGETTRPLDAVTAIQMLVAFGIASPMRSSYAGQNQAVLTYPKWETGFNKYLNESPVTTPEVLLASPVIGGVVSVSARDALVIQAINRAGMKDSVAALMPELKRVANDPALAARIMDMAEPTPESARNMILEVVSRSMIQWYAYGLLAA